MSESTLCISTYTELLSSFLPHLLQSSFDPDLLSIKVMAASFLLTRGSAAKFTVFGTIVFLFYKKFRSHKKNKTMASSFSITNSSAAKFTLFGTIVFLLFKKFRSHKKIKTTASFSLSNDSAAKLVFLLFKKFSFQIKNETMASSLPLSSPDPPPSSLPLLPPPSSLPQNWIHHVFPSFHGADVRKTLLGHLLKEFRSKGIDPFIDNNIERGKSIGPELIDAIRGSRIAIVLLSENYASSTWCLDELVEIIRCKEVLGQKVMVIFYEVIPTDVKKQAGHFGYIFRKTCEGKTKDNIERWKQALAEVAKIAGYPSSNWDNDADMIEEISNDVSTKLNNSMLSSDFDHLIGMGSHMRNMGPLLRLDLEEVRKIGILGLPGIGKTTIARFLYHRHSKDFQLSVYMENIKASYPIPALSDDYSLKLKLQKQLISQLLSQMDITIPHLGVAKDRLKFMKVLVILDDVDRLEQLEATANETSWFGLGSRIIITTQDENLLRRSGVKHIYRVDFPSSDEALQIFCTYAFGQNSPKDGFTELALDVTRLVGELPLGLKVMGSHFKEQPKERWIIELSTLRTRLDGHIESILKFSYDALSDEEKNLFLHIACFFNGEFVNEVEGCLESSFRGVTLDLHVLAEKSLISLDDKIIKMHGLLVQLGREIVRKRDLWKRQFLEDVRDVDEVLTDDKDGSSRVIGIDLKFKNENITCTSKIASRKLSDLQFLRIDGDGTNFYFPGKLRFVSWKKFPMPCFPSGFHPKFLVKLDMQESKLEKLWQENQSLSNLKWMDLSYSKSLKELPDLSTATNLCELKLSDCSSLVELPHSIGKAVLLLNLDLSYCSSLQRIPFSIGDAISLQKLDLSYCKSLVEIPSSISNAISLQELDLTYCSSLVKLPSSIVNSINSMYLNFSGCSSLVTLPFSIGDKINLQVLNLSFCSSLVELPFSIGDAINLQKMDLSHCSSLLELPSSMKNLRRLSILNLKKCSQLEVLTDINLESLEELNLSGTLIKEMPSSLRLLPPKLEISYGEIQELGPLIGRLSRLHRLVLSGMQELILLPQLPDSLLQLDVEKCKSLEKLDCSFRNPNIRLNFAKCFKLNQDARDLIIRTRTSEYTIFPGGEVPVCFTYRAYGSSLTVNLNQKPFGTSTRFTACILLADKDKYDLGHWGQAYVSWSITSKQNALSSCISSGKTLEFVFPQHMYTFEVEAMEVMSTELVFEFKLRSLHFNEIWEIKECGILQFSRKIRSLRETKAVASSSSLTSPPSSLPHNWKQTKTMASSSSLTPPPLILPHNCKRHVFPSFHGPDVRKAFLSHMWKEFRAKGIDLFNENSIERSKSIRPQLINAVRGSRISIVLLSKNYASSTWCLDELVKIIKCREVLGQTVMVIFYEVNPTDVKKQTGDFGKVFSETCRGREKDAIVRWKQALAEVSKIPGYHSQNWDSEAQMIEGIVTDVSNKLNDSAASPDLEGLVGMESHLIKMGSLLRLDLKEVRMIGILGPPGIGKTTIARFLYNQHYKDFQLSAFMGNIKAHYPMPAYSDEYGRKLHLQETFMSQLINEKGLKIPHLGIVQDRLKDKKVLVVLDDVDQLVQLEVMARKTWFGPGSRIIITTQDERLLQESYVNHIYRVDLPSSDEALQMFCKNAFRQNSSKDGFQELAWQVTRLVGGLPLGLKVMGSYFRGMSKQSWTEELPRLRIRLDSTIQSILKFSYDALAAEDKDLFLYIACFFNGEFISKLEDYLVHSFFNVTRGIHLLLEKSLIFQSYGMIKMNRLLVQLGRDIAREQSISEPRKRQFLDDATDIDEVLKDDKADGRRVIGIDLKFSYKTGDDVTRTSERAFERLHNLQFLRIDGDGNHLYFPRSLNSISRKLRFLSWRQFPMSCFPSNFHPEFLVKLEMTKSKLEKLWEGIQPLRNLKWVDLSFSKSLKELPDLSTAINLCEVDLSNCVSLVELPSSIGNAINLQTLNLSHCLSLVVLPSSIGNAISLQEMNLSHCSSLVELPSSMKNLCKLSKLDLKACSELEVCLININLESLKELDLSDCSSLKCYPETSTNIEYLKPSGTQEPSPWISRISRLHRVVLNEMQKLVSLPQFPYSLSELDAVNCESLERLDCSFRNPEIRLNFAKCFKLNQEARDLIIQTRTNEYTVLPGGEVPICFTYRASGNSATVKLNQNSLRNSSTSTIFRACITLADKDEYVSGVGSEAYVYCSITSKQDAFSTACRSKSKALKPVFVEHLYTFEVEAVNLTSTEVVFEFQLLAQNWEIKKCGIVQLMEVPDTRRGRKKELNDGNQKRMRVVME